MNSLSLVENIDMWDWVQKTRSCRFDSYLYTTEHFPLLHGWGAAGRQSNILLRQSPGVEKTLRPGQTQCVALAKNISLLTCYFCYFMYGWEPQSIWLYVGCILHQPRKEPVPHSFKHSTRQQCIIQSIKWRNSIKDKSLSFHMSCSPMRLLPSPVKKAFMIPSKVIG